MIDAHDCDETVFQLARSLIYKAYASMLLISSLSSEFLQLIHFFWRIFDHWILMADNIRRGLQNLNLGANDPPVQLPVHVLNEAVAENRFILIGRPVMPRRQNIRSIIANLPLIWGQDGIQGRLTEGRRFQFVFPTEESLEMVLRRGPWAFSDRMLIMERWSPLFNPLMLNFIPLWIQIRGIPFQYMSQDVVIHIGRALGMYMEVDYNSDTTVRRKFARVRVNWNVDEPLRFQRQFQFEAGVNTMLRLTYERLRGFCETCGMLTHDSGACLIQNGGPDNGGADDSGSEDDNLEEDPAPPQGLIIEEIVEADQQEENVGGLDAAVDENMDNEIQVEEIAEEDDALWYGNAMPTMFSEEYNMNEMFNPLSAVGERPDTREALKRKARMEAANENVSIFTNLEQGESSTKRYTRRKKNEGTQTIPQRSINNDAADVPSEDTPKEGGAVGPEPPLPP
ncbi:uncharacterized protein LOC106413280 [Brassica napus]|uniref:uncharacterized protein LOC106413280 n=1 Tax=Brassica napus TaxID=3708 RepID=UPI002079F24F|nr:uncharacterized protein LOC106413280 [Brassica napus]